MGNYRAISRDRAHKTVGCAPCAVRLAQSARIALSSPHVGQVVSAACESQNPQPTSQQRMDHGQREMPRIEHRGKAAATKQQAVTEEQK